MLMHRARVVYPPLIAIAGFALWLAVYESGIHATIAGVVMGLLTPARPIQSELEAEELVNVLENDDDIRADEVRATATLIRGSVSPCDRLIDAPAPVDELPDRADLRARQRRHRPVSRLDHITIGGARWRRRGARRRQVHRRHPVQLGRRAARARTTPRRAPDGDT